MPRLCRDGDLRRLKAGCSSVCARRPVAPARCGKLRDRYCQSAILTERQNCSAFTHQRIESRFVIYGLEGVLEHAASLRNQWRESGEA